MLDAPGRQRVDSCNQVIQIIDLLGLQSIEGLQDQILPLLLVHLAPRFVCGQCLFILSPFVFYSCVQNFWRARVGSCRRRLSKVAQRRTLLAPCWYRQALRVVIGRLEEALTDGRSPTRSAADPADQKAALQLSLRPNGARLRRLWRAGKSFLQSAPLPRWRRFVRSDLNGPRRQ